MKIPSPDAILIHAYWLSERKDGTITQSLRGHIVTEAAARIYEHNEKKPFLVLTGGRIWGDAYPSLAEVMKKELENSYGVPKDAIILHDSAFDTNDEIDVFLHLAKKYHWKSLCDLAIKKHFYTIPKLYKNKKTLPYFVAAEDIIQVLGDNQTKNDIKKLQFSFYEFNFSFYELAVWLVLFLDPQYKFLGKYAQKPDQKNNLMG